MGEGWVGGKFETWSARAGVPNCKSVMDVAVNSGFWKWEVVPSCLVDVTGPQRQLGTNLNVEWSGFHGFNLRKELGPLRVDATSNVYLLVRKRLLTLGSYSILQNRYPRRTWKCITKNFPGLALPQLSKWLSKNSPNGGQFRIRQLTASSACSELLLPRRTHPELVMETSEKSDPHLPKSESVNMKGLGYLPLQRNKRSVPLMRLHKFSLPWHFQVAWEIFDSMCKICVWLPQLLKHVTREAYLKLEHCVFFHSQRTKPFLFASPSLGAKKTAAQCTPMSRPFHHLCNS